MMKNWEEKFDEFEVVIMECLMEQERVAALTVKAQVRKFQIVPF